MIIVYLQMEVDFMRLGQARKVHSEIVPYTVQEASRKIKTVAELEKLYDSKVCIEYKGQILSKLSNETSLALGRSMGGEEKVLTLQQ